MAAPNLNVVALELLEQRGIVTLCELDAMIDALRRIRRLCTPRQQHPKRKKRPPRVTTRTRPNKAAADVVAAAVSNVAPDAGLVAWIAARLDVRGPQTTQQLAAAKGGSEVAIKQAIAQARGKFVWNEHDNTYRLAS